MGGAENVRDNGPFVDAIKGDGALIAALTHISDACMTCLLMGSRLTDLEDPCDDSDGWLDLWQLRVLVPRRRNVLGFLSEMMVGD
jgi:hypothetical protein